LLQGEISYLIEWPGLSAEEKAEGWILPCVAQARSDLLLQRP
jgi:ferredoxin